MCPLDTLPQPHTACKLYQFIAWQSLCLSRFFCSRWFFFSFYLRSIFRLHDSKRKKKMKTNLFSCAGFVLALFDLSTLFRSLFLIILNFSWALIFHLSQFKPPHTAATFRVILNVHALENYERKTLLQLSNNFWLGFFVSSMHLMQSLITN